MVVSAPTRMTLCHFLGQKSYGMFVVPGAQLEDVQEIRGAVIAAMQHSRLPGG